MNRKEIKQTLLADLENKFTGDPWGTVGTVAFITFLVLLLISLLCGLLSAVMFTGC